MLPIPLPWLIVGVMVSLFGTYQVGHHYGWLERDNDMKIAILGDTHFGMRGDSIAFHNHYKDFYLNTFFPYLVDHGIRTVFQLGDLFDRRKYISFQSLALCRNYFFDQLVKHDIQCHVLLGNHDIFFKNTLEVNSPDLLLRDYAHHILYFQG